MENFYSAISIDALRDFRNVFSSAFLRDNSGKLIAYTHSKIDNSVFSTNIRPSKNIVVVYDYDPSMSNRAIIFEFPGDGYVYISKRIDETTEIHINCECKSAHDATRENISDAIYDKFGVTIYL